MWEAVALPIEQLTGNGRANSKYWAGGELIFKSDGLVLDGLRTLSNEVVYLAVQSAWFQEFVTDPRCAVQDCYKA